LPKANEIKDASLRSDNFMVAGIFPIVVRAIALAIRLGSDVTAVASSGLQKSELK